MTDQWVLLAPRSCWSALTRWLLAFPKKAVEERARGSLSSFKTWPLGSHSLSLPQSLVGCTGHGKGRTARRPGSLGTILGADYHIEQLIDFFCGLCEKHVRKR